VNNSIKTLHQPLLMVSLKIIIIL